MVLEPGRYWQLVLQERLDELLQSKFPGSRSVRPDDFEVKMPFVANSVRSQVYMERLMEALLN